MGNLKELPPEIIAKIAAGEVVERPASVVKELVENALDAGSRTIKVEVQAGGRKLIRVTDDGEGMSPEEALLALRRYTTSKIDSLEDLFAIRTFGFRGEALSSIAAVSRMKINTKKNGQLAGVSVEVEGGAIKNSQEIGCPPGTAVEVRDLFFNVPARLKFLKTQGTELGHIGDVLSKIALAHPQIQLQLYHEGKLLAHYPIRDEPSARLAEALGKETAGKMHFFQFQNGEVKVHGYGGEPGLNLPNARAIHLFVNRRPVRDRLLSHAVMESYRNSMPKDRYPAVVLFLELPPERVDVNVHPGKWEVKFAEGEAIHRAVVQAIRRMLEKAPWLMFSADQQRPELRESSGAYYQPPGSRPWKVVAPEPFPIEARPVWTEPAASGPFLGQIDETYLLFSSSDGLLLMDQHAAHERVLLERLLKEFSSGPIRKQSFLFPETLELAPGEAQIIEEKLTELDRLGFEVEPSGVRTYWVKSVPEVLAAREPLETLKEMIREISSWGQSGQLQKSYDPLLKIMACHGAIQAHRAMRPEEANLLLADLQNCSLPSHCPHGRPTLIKISLTDLEKMFGRKKKTLTAEHGEDAEKKIL